MSTIWFSVPFETKFEVFLALPIGLFPFIYTARPLEPRQVLRTTFFSIVLYILITFCFAEMLCSTTLSAEFVTIFMSYCV